MAADIAEFLVSKFLKSLAEAESEFSGLIPISHFKSIEEVEVRDIRSNMSADYFYSFPSVIPALYDLNDALAECRIFSNEYSSQLDNKMRLLRFNPLVIQYFVLKMKKRLKTIRGKLVSGLERKADQLMDNKWNSGRSDRTTKPRDWHEWTVLGFDKEAAKIEECLLVENAGFSAVGIVGMAGAGKTTLVRKVFSSRRISGKFFPMIWVCLSDFIKGKEAPVDDCIRIVKHILSELRVQKSYFSEDATTTLGELLKKLNQVLSGERYLIVLDDVWHINDFYSDLGHSIPPEGDSIVDQKTADLLSHGLPKGSGGAVIVTSRISEVAQQMVGRNNLIPLKPLDRETCWRIFMQTINKGDSGMSYYETFEKMKNDIKKEFHGLPLAAKTLAEIINQDKIQRATSPMEAMLQTLTQRLSTALLNQDQFALDSRGQFEEMKAGFDLMRALLAEHKKLFLKRREIVKAVMMQLKEVIYEADDVLTDFLLRDEYGKDWFYCCGFLLCGRFFLRHTGKQLTDINMDIKRVYETLGRVLEATDHNFHYDDSSDFVERLMYQEYTPNMFGLNDDVEKIKAWIFDTNKGLERIAIVGIGGSGKTSIAQTFFNDLKVLSHFHKVIWVTVSQNLSEDRIIRRILRRLGENADECDVTLMLRMIEQTLKDRTCLLVMDDVWGSTDMEWWNNLCAAFPGEGSCIVITTRIEDVAIRMGVKYSRIHRMRTLNDAESWSLFSNFAFRSSKEVCPNHLETVGRQIVSKCNGLPLAIKSIGALLSHKTRLGEWWDALEHFPSFSTEGRDTVVMDSLRLSYDELPPYLKQCMLCFSIYPEDFEINAHQLVHWWTGEGFLQGKDLKTAVEVGYEYLSKLISRCLVEVVEQRGFDGRVSKCKISDTVRTLITMIAKEEQLCSFDEQCRQILDADSRWLFLGSEIDEKSLQRCTKLRALLLLTPSLRFDISRSSQLMQSLRVLDLSNCVLDDICAKDLFGWISFLKRLASLNVSGHNSLREVPSSISKLLNLQVLVLSGCRNLQRIHSSITDLKKLIILDIRGCPIRYLPHRLERLSGLQEFYGFKVSSHPRKQHFQLLEIRELIHLRVLTIHITGAKVISDNELGVLSKLTRLKVLDIDAEDCAKNDILVRLDNLALPRSLQELYLRNFRRETMPKWFNPKQLPELQYICIENSNLVNLCCDHSTWKLEGLCLKYLVWLQVEWKDLAKNMPALRYMEISHCYKLKDFPCSVMELGVWRTNQD